MGFLSKAKQSEKIHKSKFQWIKHISIVFLWEKMFGRNTTYSCRKNCYVKFHHFMKKKEKRNIDTGKTKKFQQNLFKSVGTYGFCRDTAHQNLASN